MKVSESRGNPFFFTFVYDNIYLSIRKTFVGNCSWYDGDHPANAFSFSKDFKIEFISKVISLANADRSVIVPLIEELNGLFKTN